MYVIDHKAIASLDRITKSGHDTEHGDNRESNCGSWIVDRTETINRLIAVKIEIDTFLYLLFHLFLNFFIFYSSNINFIASNL